MDDFELFDSYKKIKGSFCCLYKGVDLTIAASVELMSIIVLKEKKNWRQFFSALLRRMNVQPLIEAFTKHSVVCSFNFPKRKDHVLLAQAIQGSIQDSGLVTLTYRYSPFIHLIRFIRFYKGIAEKVACSFVNRCFLAAIYSQYSRLIDDMENYTKGIQLDGKKYIPFLAPAYTESLLTLYLNTKGVISYQVIHGYNGNYKKNIPIDIINYENIITHYILTWGQKQKDFFEVKSNKPDTVVLVAGNPKYPFKNVEVNTRMSRCIILGGTKIYDDAFSSLLPIVEEIATEEGVEFYLKPHPNSQITTSPLLKECSHITILNKDETLGELLSSKKFDFAITYNSTSFFECMYYGVIPLRYGVGENLDFRNYGNVFFDKESLRELIGTCRKDDPSALSERFKSILCDELGMGINNYDKIVNG